MTDQFKQVSKHWQEYYETQLTKCACGCFPKYSKEENSRLFHAFLSGVLAAMQVTNADLNQLSEELSQAFERFRAAKEGKE